MEETAEADEPGLMASALTLARLILGWSAVGLGVLNLSMGVDTRPGSDDWTYLLFHVVVLVTGLALLAAGLLRRRPTSTAWLCGGVVTAVGVLVGAAIPAGGGHGFPFTFLGGGSGFQPGHAVIDLIFWACLGFFALALVTHLQPGPHAVPNGTATTLATHAEQRAPAPRDENVGGLP